jgi:hypothetical protein
MTTKDVRLSREWGAFLSRQSLGSMVHDAMIVNNYETHVEAMASMVDQVHWTPLRHNHRGLSPVEAKGTHVRRCVLFWYDVVFLVYISLAQHSHIDVFCLHSNSIGSCQCRNASLRAVHRL